MESGSLRASDTLKKAVGRHTKWTRTCVITLPSLWWGKKATLTPPLRFHAPYRSPGNLCDQDEKEANKSRISMWVFIFGPWSSDQLFREGLCPQRLRAHLHQLDVLIYNSFSSMSKLTAQRTHNIEKDLILLTLWRIKEERQEKNIKKSVHQFAFCLAFGWLLFFYSTHTSQSTFRKLSWWKFILTFKIKNVLTYLLKLMSCPAIFYFEQEPLSVGPAKPNSLT